MRRLFLIWIIILAGWIPGFSQKNLPFSNPELEYQIRFDEIEEPRETNYSGLVREEDFRYSSGNNEKVEKQGDSEIVTTYYYDGKIEDKFIRKNGKKNGLRIHYDEKGRLQQEVPYVNDRIDGLKKYYYENGALAAETNYKNGKREGLRTIYLRTYDDENKKIYAIVPYKNNKINGLVKKYKRSADSYYIEYIASFSNGVPDGKWETYAESYQPMYKDKEGRPLFGRIVYKKEEENNKNGIREGKDIVFRPDGSIRSVSMFGNNVIVYNEQIDSAGNRLFLNKYVNGKSDGTHKYYYDNGNIMSEAIFETGILNGKQTFYHSNGKTETISYYTNGKLTGKKESYYENGNLKEEINYSENSKKTGIERAYFESGILREEIAYNEKGEPISETYYERYSGKKLLRMIFENGNKIAENYFNDKGELLWTNNYNSKGKAIGLRKHFYLFKLEVQSFMDEENNGYKFNYNEFNEKLVQKEYFINKKKVTEEEFLAAFSITDGIVTKK